jgi:hypothetical protein
MNKEEINRRIHLLRGKCFHETNPEDPGGPCRCGKWQHRHPNPDYFSPKTPRGELDDAVAKCVEKIGADGPEIYFKALRLASNECITGHGDFVCYRAATASPEAICMAIASCIEESR